MQADGKKISVKRSSDLLVELRIEHRNGYFLAANLNREQVAMLLRQLINAGKEVEHAVY